jgi:hypothetical protein
MNVTCDTTSARLDLGKNDPLQYIYNQGYLFKTGGSAWTPVPYTSTESLIAGAWYPKSATATIRVLIPLYATEYIGVQFNHDESGAFWSHEGSISLAGNCSEIQYPNRRASYLQLLQLALPYQSTSLRPEFADGRLRISLIAGNQQPTIHPQSMKPIYTLRKEYWPRLSLPEMYENPQSDFPPLIKEVQTP